MKNITKAIGKRLQILFLIQIFTRNLQQLTYEIYHMAK